jgi:hypothetical protein
MKMNTLILAILTLALSLSGLGPASAKTKLENVANVAPAAAITAIRWRPWRTWPIGAACPQQQTHAF